MREGARSIVDSHRGLFLGLSRAHFGRRLQVIFRVNFGAAFAEDSKWPRRRECPIMSEAPGGNYSIDNIGYIYIYIIYILYNKCSR